jgi:hypothetical protein
MFVPVSATGGESAVSRSVDSIVTGVGERAAMSESAPDRTT